MKLGRLDNPLVLGIALGIIAGAVIVSGGIANLKALAIAHTLIVAGDALCLLIFPAIMSVVARRFYFWWGFAPAVAGALVSLVFQIVAYRVISHPSLSVQVAHGLGLAARSAVLITAHVALLSSGPVSLLRYLIWLRRAKAAPQAPDEELAIAGKDGAWPPAPGNGA